MAQDLSDRVRVSPLGPISRFLNPDGTAVYTPFLNRIQLNEDHLIGSRRNYQIKNAQDIRGENYHYSDVATIFHEMGHAELDALIERESTLGQMGVMHAYRHILKDYYRQTFSVFRTYPLFHEHFAYYRTELIEFFYTEISEIFLRNGFNVHRGSCFLTHELRSLLDSGVSAKEFQKLQDFGDEGDFYRKKISPRFIFVRGKDYDLHKGNNYKQVLDQANLFFWSYHQEAYGFPINRNDFIEKMNKGGSLDKLAECRQEIFDEY